MRLHRVLNIEDVYSTRSLVVHAIVDESTAHYSVLIKRFQ